eukprot:scaffold114045_cov21-Tisochrysis_lutea.AAC.1
MPPAGHGMSEEVLRKILISSFSHSAGPPVLGRTRLTLPLERYINRHFNRYGRGLHALFFFGARIRYSWPYLLPKGVLALEAGFGTGAHVLACVAWLIRLYSSSFSPMALVDPLHASISVEKVDTVVGLAFPIHVIDSHWDAQETTSSLILRSQEQCRAINWRRTTRNGRKHTQSSAQARRTSSHTAATFASDTTSALSAGVVLVCSHARACLFVQCRVHCLTVYKAWIVFCFFWHPHRKAYGEDRLLPALFLNLAMADATFKESAASQRGQQAEKCCALGAHTSKRRGQNGETCVKISRLRPDILSMLRDREVQKFLQKQVRLCQETQLNISNMLCPTPKCQDPPSNILCPTAKCQDPPPSMLCPTAKCQGQKEWVTYAANALFISLLISKRQDLFSYQRGGELYCMHTILSFLPDARTRKKGISVLRMHQTLLFLLLPITEPV